MSAYSPIPKLTRRAALLGAAAVLMLAGALPVTAVRAEDTVKLGLVAALSGQSAKSGFRFPTNISFK